MTNYMTGGVAGRSYARVYTGLRRKELHEFILAAIVMSGGQVLYSSRSDQAPMYFGVQTPSGERIGVLIYPFLANQKVTGGRPADEHRLQMRYNNREVWDGHNPIGRDIASVDTTLILGVHLEAGLFVGLDPSLYDPLPLGISIFFKDFLVQEALGSTRWRIFERDNISGVRRADPRSPHGLETIVLFKPNRLLDYVRLERKASDLNLDTPLRFAAAVEAAEPSVASEPTVASFHALEAEFGMPSTEILEMVIERKRLAVAVRGGVAEWHLNRLFQEDPNIDRVAPLDKDAMHDFDVVMLDGTKVRVECKNCSKERYKNGEIKVETQKTRASKNDPASRFYKIDQFDVVAACLWSPTGEWTFAFRKTSELALHDRHEGRLAALQRVNDTWARTLTEAL
jgi:hypothetical protein